jgi:tRNA (cytidine/uridine-2'-O-)-methyltransferase
MLKIALINPQIPQNTGNVARLAAGINGRLILVGKLGFSLDDKYLKRAGLDYWEYVDLETVESIQFFLDKYSPDEYYYAMVTKFGNKRYDKIYEDALNNKKEVLFVFGNETEGLPDSLHSMFKSQRYFIPMNDKHIRSLNLSNSVALVIYDYLRQMDFRGINV